MTESRRYSIKEVNEMHKDAFISVFGSVFEDTTWAAIRAFEKLPFTSNNALKDIMCQLIEKSGEQAQLALLCAHPELGSKAKMADASMKEQSDAGIPASDDVIKEKMLKLNVEYRNKFDFPFIIAVKGLSAVDILENMEERLQNNRDDEFKECLGQVLRIARFRLDDLLEEDN